MSDTGELPPAPRRVLVTGSSGFVGGHVTRLLRQEGFDVLGLDHVSASGAPDQPGQAIVNLLDREGLLEAFSSYRPHYVIHLAARTDLNGAAVSDYAANVDGVANLLNAIRAVPGIQRCIFTSSQLVCRVGYVPRDELDYCPNTVYGQSKVRTEQIVRQQDGGGVEWCIARPTTVWGPGMGPHYQNLLRLISGGRYFHVSRRALYKSYGYVENVAWQYRKLLDAPSELMNKKVFYVADYDPLSLRDWIDAFQRHLDAPVVPTCPPALARVAALAGDTINLLGIRSFPFNSFRLRNIMTEYTFDLSATRSVCGPPPVTLDDGVAATVAWFLALPR